MKRFLLLLLLLLTACGDGCVSDNINACSHACESSFKSMVKYSRANGCECGPKADGAPAK